MCHALLGGVPWIKRQVGAWQRAHPNWAAPRYCSPPMDRRSREPHPHRPAPGRLRPAALPPRLGLTQHPTPPPPADTGWPVPGPACPACGQALPARPEDRTTGRPARYCSPTCRSHAYRTRHAPGETRHRTDTTHPSRNPTRVTKRPYGPDCCPCVDATRRSPSRRAVELLRRHQRDEPRCTGAGPGSPALCAGRPASCRSPRLDRGPEFFGQLPVVRDDDDGAIPVRPSMRASARRTPPFAVPGQDGGPWVLSLRVTGAEH